MSGTKFPAHLAHDYLNSLAGEADEETRLRVWRMIEDPQSEMNRAIEEYRHERKNNDWDDAIDDSATETLATVCDRRARPAKTPRRSAGRTAWIAAVALLVPCVLMGVWGLSNAAWAVSLEVWAAFHPPLLADMFDDEHLDAKKWNFHLDAKESRMQETRDGTVRLDNRAYLVTGAGHPGSKSIKFDWQWIDRLENPNYLEILTVVLRTTGKPRAKHAWEVEDGLLVQFNCRAGRVILAQATTGVHEIRHVDLTDKDAVIIPPETWHTVRITDDGSTVSVYITPRDKPVRDAKPVLVAKYAGEFADERIAIYNRELVGEVPHRSYLDNFSIERFSAPK